MPHEFLERWASWKPGAPPFLLPGDRTTLLSSFAAGATSCFSTPEEYIDDDKFNDPDDTAFHLGLHPMPVLGDLQRAKVVFLLLNPGLKPGDYFAERDRGAYWRALRQSTRQTLYGVKYPFLFLNPAFSWHPGFSWWSRKLAILIRLQMMKQNQSPKDALSSIAKSVASIELYPYHSRKFNLRRRLRRELVSAKLARAYVHDVLLPRARGGRLLLVAMRRVKEWGLTCEKGVCMFNASEARGAHLNVRSQVGRGVLAHLGLLD